VSSGFYRQGKGSASGIGYGSQRVKFMQKLLTLLISLTLFYGTAQLWAQEPVFDHPLSAQNQENFNAICAQLASRPYAKGVFEQTRTLTKQKRSLVSGGDFIIAADLGVVWITKFPVPSLTTLGRDFMIQSVPGGTRTRIDAKGNEIYLNMADTISSLFTGNIQRLQSGFVNYYTETQTSDGKVWTVGLVPKDKVFRNYAQRIVFEGFDDTQRAVIRSIVIYERNGDSLSYVFSQQSFPARLETHEQAYFSAD
jgi:hypothetical protein